MFQRISLKTSIITSFLAIACLASRAAAQDLSPLRSCARSLSVNVEGDRFKEGFAGDDEDSMYFIDCDDNSNAGKDHYILTVNGIWHLFEKSHSDYKGGMEPTIYRFTLGTETFYYKANIFGEMGDIFDFKGMNLSQAAGTSSNKLDISIKNPVLAYYMKTLTGKSDPKAALIAAPMSSDRIPKLQGCLRKQLSYLGNSLFRTYLARARDESIDPSTLAKYRETTSKALSHAACHTDDEISSKFNKFLVNLP